jgi:serine/threonine protein kinase
MRREMFMGERPWKGLSHSQIIHALSMGQQLTLPGSCPSLLRKFIMRCMAPKPSERPTFEAALLELDELEEELVGMVGDMA